MKIHGTEPNTERDRAVEVGIAEYAVSENGDELSTLGLGSCVAIALYDDGAGVSGLAHVMLPSASGGAGDAGDVGKYADTAIRSMLEEMESRGADSDAVRAKVVGGSEMFDFSGIAEGVGRRNVEATRRELKSLGIPVESEDVGGDHGRSVRLDAATGALRLKTAENGVVEL